MDIILLVVALGVAFGNGANDNFKGFASVWGSDTLSYRKALTLATLATLATIAGSIASWWLEDSLVRQFSGKGIVSDATSVMPAFALSVGLGAAGAVSLATRLGFPISTTHAILGGLVGAGAGINDGQFALDRPAATFVLPLLLSPLLAALLAISVHRLLRLRSTEYDCVCFTTAGIPAGPDSDGSVVAADVLPTLLIASDSYCNRIQPPCKLST